MTDDVLSRLQGAHERPDGVPLAFVPVLTKGAAGHVHNSGDIGEHRARRGDAERLGLAPTVARLLVTQDR